MHCFSLLPHPIICIHQMETFKKEHLHCVDLIFYRPSPRSTVLTQYTLHSISFVDCPLFLSSLYLSFSVFLLLIPFRQAAICMEVSQRPVVVWGWVQDADTKGKNGRLAEASIASDISRGRQQINTKLSDANISVRSFGLALCFSFMFCSAPFFPSFFFVTFYQIK